MSWPRIAEGRNLLITAPTGSGKTLTAFLWTLNRFATGDLQTGKTRVLYISPLKALNNDIQKNLLEPLAELKSRFDESNEIFPAVNVATRSGDTDAGQRRRMLRHPPEILITTPESLNILLSSRGGQNMLYDIDTLILDEIHGVVDSKRGVYLMSAVERLVNLSGEFQRIALSATVNPLETVADFIAGYTFSDGSYTKRVVETLISTAHKAYDITIRYPERAATRGEDEKVWDYLAEDILPRIHQNQSTLVFVNSRALCEKLTFKINTAAGRVVAYAHHGSLSREIRTEVETRLKEGKLDAIVATSTLEMGIDIGALDEVILVQSPGSIASTIQRIGRAGHQVGVSSRCTIYPTHPQDFIEAAVLAKAVTNKAVEPITTINNPLDVLGQVIISMTGTESWDIDELYSEILRSTPYHTLRRSEFDLVINMLLGRYADHHIHELRPRVRVDRTNNRIEAKKGALLSLYLSGGVIPDRGYFQLRHEGDNARIGELDEEFVWEANVGQVFSLGTQTWQVKKITHNDVIVAPAKPGSSAPPFWKAESINRSFEYSKKIGEFLEHANETIADANNTETFKSELVNSHSTEGSVADEIITFLKRQKKHSRCDLPHRHHLVFERIRSGPGAASGQQLVIHTGWGARVNRPLAMALEAAWQERFDEQPEVFVANESLVLQLPHEITAAALLEMVPAHRLEELLRIRLEGSGFFGARFRENAGRSLLLSKGRFNERKPLWMSRLQSQKLMDSVLKYEDFPILLETWRTCLHDEFDIVNLKNMLQEIETRQIMVSETDSASPSPFAQSVAWGQINAYMYMSDTPKATKVSNLREDLLKEVVFNPGLRPSLRREIVTNFVIQRHRLDTPYLPQDRQDLEDWIKERSVIPIGEWHQLTGLLSFDITSDFFTYIRNETLVVSLDDAHRFEVTLSDSRLDESAQELEILISNWLQYYGPVSPSFVSQCFGIPESTALICLESLMETSVAVSGKLLEKDETHLYCDSTNYEYLLRIQRARSRPVIEAKPIEALTPFMFAWQTRYSNTEPLDRLYECLDRLRGLPLQASLWESEVLPARLAGYETSHLDLLFQEGEVQWLGMTEKTVSLCFKGDTELIRRKAVPASELLEDEHARYDFSGLLDKTDLSATELASQLWREVWEGRVSNDSIGALRRGIETEFKVEDSLFSKNVTRTGRGHRGTFNRWQGSMPFTGNWFRVPDTSDELDLLELDLLEQQELDKERARLLLSRYGLVFRELCQRESAAFKWAPLFRALRLMELSGEVVSGRFFENIPGPQYITATALGLFQKDRSGSIFFINAADPISPSGLGLGSHGQDLPRRVPSNYLVYHGQALVLTVAKRGKELLFHVPPDSKDLPSYLEVLHHLIYRSFQPVKQLRVEFINQVTASTSAYLPALRDQFNLFSDYKSIVIQREL